MIDKLKPTAEQIQRACDLANVAGVPNWKPKNYAAGNICATFTALADTLARAEKAEADLGEVDALLKGQPPINSSLTDAQAIAAPYRVETDPLVECLKQHLTMGTSGWSDQLWADMAKSMRRDLSERGVTVGEQTDAK